jgi:hypothetical protein
MLSLKKEISMNNCIQQIEHKRIRTPQSQIAAMNHPTTAILFCVELTGSACNPQSVNGYWLLAPTGNPQPAIVNGYWLLSPIRNPKSPIRNPQ